MSWMYFKAKFCLNSSDFDNTEQDKYHDWNTHNFINSKKTVYDCKEKSVYKHSTPKDDPILYHLTDNGKIDICDREFSWKMYHDVNEDCLVLSVRLRTCSSLTYSNFMRFIAMGFKVQHELTIQLGYRQFDMYFNMEITDGYDTLKLFVEASTDDNEDVRLLTTGFGYDYDNKPKTIFKLLRRVYRDHKSDDASLRLSHKIVDELNLNPLYHKETADES